MNDKKRVIKKELSNTQRRLVQEHIISKTNKYWGEIDNLSYLSKNLYNHALYLLRQNLYEFTNKYNEWKTNTPDDKSLKPTKNKFGFYELDPILRNNIEYPDYKKLPAQTSQQILKKLDGEWKSYTKSFFDYLKNPSKYKGFPKPPNFKHKTNGRYLVVYTGANGISKTKLKNNIINPSKTNIEIPFHIPDVQITEVRFVPMSNQQYKVEIVYVKDMVFKDLNKNNHLFIDIGIDNLLTCLDNIGNKPFIISGKLIKSVNREYNNNVSRLKSIIQKLDNKRNTTNKINSLTNKRNNKIKSIMHKITTSVINYCIEHKINTIVIGKNDGWKSNLSDKMPKEFNQRFISIPHQMIINQLKYKMDNIGGDLIEHEESYTSKCDHFAFESMAHQDEYKGKRNSKKAIFTSSLGIELHDDVNGCIGIARKHYINKPMEKDFINMIKEKELYFPYKMEIKI